MNGLLSLTILIYTFNWSLLWGIQKWISNFICTIFGIMWKGYFIIKDDAVTESALLNTVKKGAMLGLFVFVIKKGGLEK